MKGIILAGGFGTRLYPTTSVISKQLLPVYDKPMVYYPLSILMLAGITDILIITTGQSISSFRSLLNDGRHLGINITYASQDNPDGIAQAFIIGESFIGSDSVALILGDNIFYGHGLISQLRKATKLDSGAIIFGYHVQDPERYGVAVVSYPDYKVLSIEEKPIKPKSHIAVTGLYFFDNSVIAKAKESIPSHRGELEITGVIQKYLDEEQCTLQLLGRGIAWLDTGTCQSLLDASNFIATIEKRQGYKIACLEEIAYKLGYINKTQVLLLAKKFNKSGYGDYLAAIVNQES